MQKRAKRFGALASLVVLAALGLVQISAELVVENAHCGVKAVTRQVGLNVQPAGD
jgi:hypothetical protein